MAKNSIRSLDIITRKIPTWAGNAAEKAIKTAEREAKSTRVFRDRTGNHRASIQGELDRAGGFNVRAVLRAGMVYSPFLELGTSQMSPRPHLWVAMQSTLVGRDEFTNELKSSFRRIL